MQYLLMIKIISILSNNLYLNYLVTCLASINFIKIECFIIAIIVVEKSFRLLHHLNSNYYFLHYLQKTLEKKTSDYKDWLK